MSDKKPVSGHRAGPETQVSYVPGTWGSLKVYSLLTTRRCLKENHKRKKK